MLKGEIGLKSIFTIVLSLMALSLLVSVSSVGSLGGAIQQGFDRVGETTDLTVNVDDKETISDLAMFVRDRAVNCDKVEDRNNGEPAEEDPRNSPNGYPGLSEHSRLGQNPECFGGDASVTRGIGNSLPIIPGSEDNFMPGIYSRERFEVTERVILRDERPPTKEANDEYDKNDVWLENSIAAVSANSFDYQVNQSASSYFGTQGNYVVFFEEDGVGEKRTNQLLEEYEMRDYDFSSRVWAKKPKSFLWLELVSDDDSIRYDATNLALCPGDKGYIQTNIGSEPTNDGIADSTTHNYPRIVITETEQESCGDVNLGREDMIPDDAVTKGQVLSITTRNGIGRSYPYFFCTESPLGCPEDVKHVFNLHDVKEDGYERDPTWGGSIEIYPNKDTCHIGVFDTSRISAQDSEGNIAVAQGYRLEKDAGSFPSESSPYVVGMSFRNRAMVNAEDVYSSYIENGLDKRSTEITSPILYSYTGEPRLELYGDLVCAQDGEWSSWTMCGGEEEDGDTVQAGEREWTCNGETGDWTTDDARDETSEQITITNEWDEATPESQEWLETNGDSFTINPEDTPEEIGMSWEEEFPTIWQNFSVSVTPQKRGHLRIGGYGEGNYASTPYFFFGAEGVSGENDKIYMNIPEGENKELATYETGRTYTFTFDRENSMLKVEEDGETVSEQGTESLNFERIRIYQVDWAERAEAKIENINVNYLQLS